MEVRRQKIGEDDTPTSVARTTDVVVCGGGPAGICAAVAAARGGLKVLLIEQYGFLGGMATGGLVNPIYGFGYFEKGKQLVTGIPEELVQALARLEGGTLGHQRRIECETCDSHDACPTHGVSSLLSFDPEAFKYAALTMLEKEGVEILLYSRVLTALMDSATVMGVAVATKSGRQVIRGAVVIDATGDGDVAAAAGNPYQVGRSQDGAIQPQSLIFRVGNVKRDENRFRQILPNLPGRRSALSVLLFRLPRTGEYIVNCDSGIHGADPLRVEDLTRVHAETLKATRDIMAAIRTEIPGCQDSYLVSTAAHLGIRESRRIVGEYVLTKDDVLNCRKFPDGICKAAFPIDIHDLTESPDDCNPMLCVKCGDYYEIPYRCLVPCAIDNLLLAGRCISGTHEAHGSYRVMGTCMAVGQAAGTAAVLATTKGVVPRRLDGVSVRRALIENGVTLSGAKC